ncbi:hypothetical protein Zmor_008893, partial [Zophobas morio]
MQNVDLSPKLVSSRIGSSQEALTLLSQQTASVPSSPYISGYLKDNAISNLSFKVNESQSHDSSELPSLLELCSDDLLLRDAKETLCKNSPGCPSPCQLEACCNQHSDAKKAKASKGIDNEHNSAHSNDCSTIITNCNKLNKSNNFEESKTQKRTEENTNPLPTDEVKSTINLKKRYYNILNDSFSNIENNSDESLHTETRNSKDIPNSYKPKRRKRRTFSELNRNVRCPIRNCERKYAS